MQRRCAVHDRDPPVCPARSLDGADDTLNAAAPPPAIDGSLTILTFDSVSGIVPVFPMTIVPGWLGPAPGFPFATELNAITLALTVALGCGGTGTSSVILLPPSCDT